MVTPHVCYVLTKRLCNNVPLHSPGLTYLETYHLHTAAKKQKKCAPNNSYCLTSSVARCCTGEKAATTQSSFDRGSFMPKKKPCTTAGFTKRSYRKKELMWTLTARVMQSASNVHIGSSVISPPRGFFKFIIGSHGAPTKCQSEIEGV